MMNRKRFSKKLAAMMLAGTMIFGMSTTAFAQASPTEDTQTETTVEDATPETTEAPAPLEEEEATPQEEAETGAAFTVPGNAEVLDDVTDGSSKEFLTIRTENNQTFYVIIDRSTNQQNVYMLSNIDENDLQEFLDEDSKGITGETSVVLEEQPTTSAVTETPKEEVKAKTSSNKGALFAILAIALCGLAGYYYFKIYKPKKEEEDYENENMELSDGLETINEDEVEEKETMKNEE